MKRLVRLTGVGLVGIAMIIALIGYLQMTLGDPYLLMCLPAFPLYPFVVWFVYGYFPWLWYVLFIGGIVLYSVAYEEGDKWPLSM